MKKAVALGLVLAVSSAWAIPDIQEANLLEAGQVIQAEETDSSASIYLYVGGKFVVRHTTGGGWHQRERVEFHCLGSGFRVRSRVLFQEGASAGADLGDPTQEDDSSWFSVSQAENLRPVYQQVCGRSAII